MRQAVAKKRWELGGRCKTKAYNDYDAGVSILSCCSLSKRNSLCAALVCNRWMSTLTVGSTCVKLCAQKYGCWDKRPVSNQLQVQPPAASSEHRWFRCWRQLADTSGSILRSPDSVIHQMHRCSEAHCNIKTRRNHFWRCKCALGCDYWWRCKCALLMKLRRRRLCERYRSLFLGEMETGFQCNCIALHFYNCRQTLKVT